MPTASRSSAPDTSPNNLTVEKIRTGNSNIRNLILASYVAKGLLPYHGIGSGIQRALQDWPDIVFTDDREGCLFISTVLRKRASPGTVGTEKSSEKTPENGSPNSSPKSSPKTEERILSMIRRNPAVTTETMGAALGISKRAVLKQIAALKEQSRLRRVGPAKGGHWEVLT